MDDHLKILENLFLDSELMLGSKHKQKDITKKNPMVFDRGMILRSFDRSF